MLVRSIVRIAVIASRPCGAGFSLRGTSVPLERRAGTCGGLKTRPTFCHRILRASIGENRFAMPTSPLGRLTVMEPLNYGSTETALAPTKRWILSNRILLATWR